MSGSGSGSAGSVAVAVPPPPPHPSVPLRTAPRIPSPAVAVDPELQKAAHDAMLIADHIATGCFAAAEAAGIPFGPRQEYAAACAGWSRQFAVDALPALRGFVASTKQALCCDTSETAEPWKSLFFFGVSLAEDNAVATDLALATSRSAAVSQSYPMHIIDFHRKQLLGFALEWASYLSMCRKAAAKLLKQYDYERRDPDHFNTVTTHEVTWKTLWTHRHAVDIPAASKVELPLLRKTQYVICAGFARTESSDRNTVENADSALVMQALRAGTPLDWAACALGRCLNTGLTRLVCAGALQALSHDLIVSAQQRQRTKRTLSKVLTLVQAWCNEITVPDGELIRFPTKPELVRQLGALVSNLTRVLAACRSWSEGEMNTPSKSGVSARLEQRIAAPVKRVSDACKSILDLVARTGSASSSTTLSSYREIREVTEKGYLKRIDRDIVDAIYVAASSANNLFCWVDGTLKETFHASLVTVLEHLKTLAGPSAAAAVDDSKAGAGPGASALAADLGRCVYAELEAKVADLSDSLAQFDPKTIADRQIGSLVASGSGGAGAVRESPIESAIRAQGELDEILECLKARSDVAGHPFALPVHAEATADSLQSIVLMKRRYVRTAPLPGIHRLTRGFCVDKVLQALQAAVSHVTDTEERSLDNWNTMRDQFQMAAQGIGEQLWKGKDAVMRLCNRAAEEGLFSATAEKMHARARALGTVSSAFFHAALELKAIPAPSVPSNVEWGAALRACADASQGKWIESKTAILAAVRSSDDLKLKCDRFLITARDGVLQELDGYLQSFPVRVELTAAIRSKLEANMPSKLWATNSKWWLSKFLLAFRAQYHARLCQLAISKTAIRQHALLELIVPSFCCSFFSVYCMPFLR